MRSGPHAKLTDQESWASNCSPWVADLLCVCADVGHHTLTTSEASGRMTVLNVPLIKYSHNGKRNNDFVNLSLQVLCFLNCLLSKIVTFWEKILQSWIMHRKTKRSQQKSPELEVHIQTQSSRYAMWARRVKVKADTTSLLILLKLLLSLVYSKSV